MKVKMSFERQCLTFIYTSQQNALSFDKENLLKIHTYLRFKQETVLKLFKKVQA